MPYPETPRSEGQPGQRVAVRQVVQEVNQGSKLNGATDGTTLPIHTQKARMFAAAPALWEVMIEHVITLPGVRWRPRGGRTIARSSRLWLSPAALLIESSA